jgi:hypothetical protein
MQVHINPRHRNSTLRRVIYAKDGVNYAAVIRAESLATVQIEMLKRQVGRSAIVRVESMPELAWR